MSEYESPSFTGWDTPRPIGFSDWAKSRVIAAGVRAEATRASHPIDLLPGTNLMEVLPLKSRPFRGGEQGLDEQAFNGLSVNQIADVLWYELDGEGKADPRLKLVIEGVRQGFIKVGGRSLITGEPVFAVSDDQAAAKAWFEENLHVLRVDLLDTVSMIAACWDKPADMAFADLNQMTPMGPES